MLKSLKCKVEYDGKSETNPTQNKTLKHRKDVTRKQSTET